MRLLRCLAAAAALVAAALPVHAGPVRLAPPRPDQRAASKKLSREETVALFARLAEAAKAAKTFRAKMRREERTDFVIGAEPIVSEGRWLVERLAKSAVGRNEMPIRFRQDVFRPRKGALFITRKDLWVSFPESREAQHADLTKGSKGSNATVETFTLWLYFDLDAIEKTYRVKARAVEPPEGLTIRKGGGRAAAKPEKMYRVTFLPRDEEKATFIELSLWLDGLNPWPLRIEKETDDGTVATQFSEVVLDEPVDAGLFNFTPPRGTKVQELGE